MVLHMLTTIDNPYDPFTQYDEWYEFDRSSGYHTPSLLARLTITSNDLSETDQDNAIEIAIDEVVRENVNGVYKKVQAPSGWASSEVA
jgi:hypothetical protein